MDGKRTRTALFALGVILLGVNLWQGVRISDLENRMSDLRNALIYQVNDLSGEVRSLSRRLEEGEKSVRDWELTPAGIDREAGCLSAELSLTLKEWGADTEVWLTARQGPDTSTVFLENQETGRFSGTVPVSLRAGEALRLEARVDSGGASRQEELGAWDDVSMLLPLRTGGNSYGGPVYRQGVFTLHDYTIYLLDQEGEPAEAEEPVFSLECGGEVLWQGPGVMSDDQGYAIGSGTENLSGDFSDGAAEVECQTGDTLELFFTCRDAYGLRYVFPLQSWEIDGEGKLPVTAPAAWPLLSWD